MLNIEAFFFFTSLLYKYLGQRGLTYRLVLLLVNISSICNWINRHVRAKQQPDDHLQLCPLNSNFELQDGGRLSVQNYLLGLSREHRSRVHSHPQQQPGTTTNDLRINIFMQGFSTLVLLTFETA